MSSKRERFVRAQLIMAHGVSVCFGTTLAPRRQLEEPKVKTSLILRSLCGYVLCVVADPAQRRGRHRTPYKPPLR